MTGQLDIFNQPPPEREDGDVELTPANRRVYQLTELPGETFEDIFAPYTDDTPEAA